MSPLSGTARADELNALERSRWFSFARFDPTEVEAWNELLLQLGVRVPDDLATVVQTKGLPNLPLVRARSGGVMTGSMSMFSADSVFWQARSAAVHVEIGRLTTTPPESDERRQPSGLFLDGSGRIGHNGTWTASLAEQLESTEERLRSLHDVRLEFADADDEPRPKYVPPSSEKMAELKRASGRPWWFYAWRDVFRHHPDPRLAREILADIGNAHSSTRGGSLVSVDDLVHRLPATARRTWLVEELHLAAPPTPELAVALDELSEALDGRPLPREKLERLVPFAWADRSPRVGAPVLWARALLFALGRPAAEHLLYALHLVQGTRESEAQWARALRMASAAGVL